MGTDVCAQTVAERAPELMHPMEAGSESNTPHIALTSLPTCARRFRRFPQMFPQARRTG